jgi:hypothetical protein
MVHTAVALLPSHLGVDKTGVDLEYPESWVLECDEVENLARGKLTSGLGRRTRVNRRNSGGATRNV